MLLDGLLHMGPPRRTGLSQSDAQGSLQLQICGSQLILLAPHANFFSRTSIVTDFGRSMGRPSARLQIPCTCTDVRSSHVAHIGASFSDSNIPPQQVREANKLQRACDSTPIARDTPKRTV